MAYFYQFPVGGVAGLTIVGDYFLEGTVLCTESAAFSPLTRRRRLFLPLPATMSAFLKLRPVDADDEPFLRQLRAQVDVERLGLHAWSPEQSELARRLIDMQFKAHGAHYKQVKADQDTKDCIIELGGVPVGRFIVTQNGKEVYLSDIAVHREHRGKGLGQAVIETAKAECVQSKRVLRLHVDPLNPVVHFYLNLGFRVVEAHPVSYLMEWVPSTVADKATRYL